MTYAIILAGGKGRRLWPVSRQNMPKQFIDFFGLGRTLLQQTFDRMAKIVPEDNIFVVTRENFQDIARQQLPDLPPSNLILETINRNTAPATLLALRSIYAKETQGNEGMNAQTSAPGCADNERTSVIIIPADQVILREDNFKCAVQRGASYAREHNSVLTIGVTPSRPEPGYGYIQKGDGENDFYHVKSFTEKPDREFARMFIDSGEWLWNTSIYMACFHKLKDHLERILNAEGNHDFSSLLNLSLDMAILEKMEHKAVMQCDFGWADIGTWHGIYEALSTDETDNVVVNTRSRILADDSMHNVVALPDGKFAVLSGLNGYIVAEKDDVLLVCKKEDSSACVRKLLSRIENEDGLEGYI